jgi:alpha-beta hydrolase superfamily lysophospholipase
MEQTTKPTVTAAIPQPKRIRWIRCHAKLVICLMMLFGFASLNAVAYMHAYAMTHFVDGGNVPLRPEQLSFLGKVWVIMTGVTVPKPFVPATPAGARLAYTVHRIPSTDNIELELWHIPHPTSKGLVLVFHGYAACKAHMLPEAEAFHELGYATLLVDLRGCGGSSGRETSIGVTEAEDVAAAFRYAQTTWPGEPLLLFGTSMGSAAILHAVQQHELQPKAVMIECPFDRLLSTVKHRFTAMGLPSFPFAQLLVFWGGVQQGFNGFGHNPMDYARGVHCPVLQLQGAADQRVHPEEAAAIFANLGTENKRFELLEGVEHESYVHAKPREWKRLVREFLEQLGLPVKNS